MNKYFLCSIVLCLFLISCNDDKLENTRYNSHFDLLNEPTEIVNAGIVHNAVLAELVKDTSLSCNDSLSCRIFASKVAHEMKVYDSNYDSTSIYNGLIPKTYGQIGIDSVTTFVSQALDDYDFIASLFSNSERNLMNSFRTNIVQADFSSLTVTQAFDSIATLINSLITQYNSIDWDTVSSSGGINGELIGGTLRIAKESTEYHKNNPSSLVFLIVWLDAAGFIGQETYEITAEISEFGHLDKKNSRKRVSHSIGRAAETSTLGFIGRFHP